jgi:hypothetical protein
MVLYKGDDEMAEHRGWDGEMEGRHVVSLELSKQLYNLGWKQGIAHNTFYWIVRRHDQKSWLAYHMEAQHVLSNRCVDVYGAPTVTALLAELSNTKVMTYLHLHYGVVRDEGWANLTIETFRNADSVAEMWIELNTKV